MHEQPSLQSYLEQLRLPTMARNYARVADTAARNNKSHQEYLLELCEQELQIKQDNSRKKRIKQASFPTIKNLDEYDFSALPSLNKPLVLQLFKGDFLSDKENVIFLGGIGTGKTHLAIALGAQACLQNKKVKFSTVGGLIHELLDAQREHRLIRFQQQLTKIDLLILDELGMVPYDKDGASLLFQIISARYERYSTVITTNLEFKDWTQVFGSQQLTAATLDRLTHRCHIVEMNGDSYRFRQSCSRKLKSKNPNNTKSK